MGYEEVYRFELPKDVDLAPDTDVKNRARAIIAKEYPAFREEMEPKYQKNYPNSAEVMMVNDFNRWAFAKAQGKV